MRWRKEKYSVPGIEPRIVGSARDLVTTAIALSLQQCNIDGGLKRKNFKAAICGIML
jgi:hypothetical protein